MLDITHSEVIKFINDFKGIHKKEIENVFYNGYCYWFAYILCGRFIGEIWFNPDEVHFACKIQDKIYDICGEIENTDGWIKWSEFQLTNQYLVEEITNSCILKNRNENNNI